MPQNSNKKYAQNKGLKNVLVIRFSAIGDVAMTVPVVYSACRNYPDTRFIFLTRKSMTSIFLNTPANLVVIGADLKQEYKGLCGVRRLFSLIRKKYEIDAVIDLHDVLRTKYIRLLSRLHFTPASRIHKDRRGKHALTRSHDKIMLPLTSSRQRYRDTFTRAGLPVTECFDGLFAPGKAPAEGYAPITPPRSSGEHWIGIAPFAKHQGKIYPPQLMEQVIAGLSSEKGIRIFLFGGGEHESLILGQWEKKYPGVKSLASERHGFGTELALISNLDLVVSMDSANMHLAAITSTPVISIWGATHPYCGFMGWRQQEDNIIQLPLTCRPCSVFGDKPCRNGDYLCLSGINPKIIIDKVLSIIKH